MQIARGQHSEPARNNRTNTMLPYACTDKITRVGSDLAVSIHACRASSTCTKHAIAMRQHKDAEANQGAMQVSVSKHAFVILVHVWADGLWLKATAPRRGREQETHLMCWHMSLSGHNRCVTQRMLSRGGASHSAFATGGLRRATAQRLAASQASVKTSTLPHPTDARCERNPTQRASWARSRPAGLRSPITQALGMIGRLHPHGNSVRKAICEVHRVEPALLRRSICLGPQRGGELAASVACGGRRAWRRPRLQQPPPVLPEAAVHQAPRRAEPLARVLIQHALQEHAQAWAQGLCARSMTPAPGPGGRARPRIPWG